MEYKYHEPYYQHIYVQNPILQIYIIPCHSFDGCKVMVKFTCADCQISFKAFVKRFLLFLEMLAHVQGWRRYFRRLDSSSQRVNYESVSLDISWH